ncbi:glycosyltransferase [Mesorhizobium sp. Cs1299R1N1]|uniref:glycosyltransferase n=1 Tax=Mesorhizobium sp. Cs1299R1N1 TaxID=3015172 RepID=UPI00301BD447
MAKMISGAVAFEMPERKPIIPWDALPATIKPDKYIATPGANFGCAGNSRYMNEIFDDSSHTEVVWQPDVYHEAADLAITNKLKRVIDLGCGNALKLKASFDVNSFEIVAVDFKASLASAKENFPKATFVECDFSEWSEAVGVAVQLSKIDVPTVIIVSDVIEHLLDPRPLLALVRTILASNPSNRVLFSTPDRGELEYAAPNSFPANKAHVREWTLEELCEFLTAAGFHVNRAGHTRPNKFDPIYSTSFVECSFRKKEYENFLVGMGIPAGMATTALLVTTEYPGINRAGGIGTFVASQFTLDSQSAVLIVDENADASQQRLLFSKALFSIEDLKDLPSEDIALKCVEQVLFFVPTLQSVEFQDYTGVGCRLAQAKSSGLLPDSLRTIVHCHGNLYYIENASERWFNIDQDTIAEREKISIELADKIIFPTTYLRNLYIENGIAVDSFRVEIIPYWYDTPTGADINYSDVDTLVFIGKQNRMKGFDLFCNALSANICEKLQEAGISKIVIIGPKVPNEEPCDTDSIRRSFIVEEHNQFDHARLLEFIEANRESSLFIQPYRADNFPLAVYDVVANGGTLLAAKAGGIPEIFQSDGWADCLFDATSASLAEKLIEATGWPTGVRANIHQKLIANIISNNQRAVDLKGVGRVTATKPSRLLSSTVVIPFFNTYLGYVRELFLALNEQSLAPEEVIIVDDASAQANVEALRKLAEETLRYPYRIISHEHNLGLAGARNTALAECKTDLLLNIDSDDIPLTNWIKNIVRALSRNPKAAVAVPYLQGFGDGENFNVWGERGKYIYRAIGDGFVISQAQNVLGHANSGVRVSLARELGGWGHSNKAKWEDWAFYLNTIAKGHRIAIIPTIDCLYRVRPDSMVRTYTEWPALKRIAQANSVLPRFESIQLQRQIRGSVEKTGRLSYLNQRIASLERERFDLSSHVELLLLHVGKIEEQLNTFRNRKIIRLVHQISVRLARYPKLRRVVVKSVRASWRAARCAKRAASAVLQR